MEVLEIAKNGALKTKIMNEVGLSYAQLERYLNALEEAGLVIKKSRVWRTTKKDLNVIEACTICHSLMEKVK